jgi:hypothetical protein
MMSGRFDNPALMPGSVAHANLSCLACGARARSKRFIRRWNEVRNALVGGDHVRARNCREFHGTAILEHRIGSVVSLSISEAAEHPAVKSALHHFC